MSSATGGSGSSSDLYSPSDSDDPLFGTITKPQDRPAFSKGLHSSGHAVAHNTTLRNEVARSEKILSIAMQSRTDAERGVSNAGASVELNNHNKRKRDQVDEGRNILAGRRFQAAAQDSIPNGHDASTPRSIPESGCSDPFMKRTRLAEDSLEVFQGNSVAGETPKPSAKVASLPIEIWQNVFCFVPPVFLGRLLRVSHTFNSLLNPNVSVEWPNQGSSTRAATHRTPSSIWAASRKRFCPGLPKPLYGLNDLDMWRLLRGSDCQLCGDKMVLLTSSNAPNQYESGPANTGVRVIWPFSVRSCGPCLIANSEKELALFLSSNFPHVLLPALPFAFISPGENVVTSHALKIANGPIEVQLTKLYWKPHIEEIKRQYRDVLELGSASAEEWVKGLESKGRERFNDVGRWEQWEAKGGLIKVNSRPSSKARSFALKKAPVTSSSANLKPAVQFAPGIPTSSHVIPPGLPINEHASLAQSPPIAFPPPSYTSIPAHGSLPQRPQAPAPQLRPERNIRDVNESKAARRAEIERRCLLLEPPLEPNILCHMESFQAALQISTALTDQAWEVLKPRLLAQRESAERREQERIQQGKLLQAKSNERKHQESQLKEAKELLDKEWDGVQGPIRERLATYADEIIRESWSDGNAVTKDTCAKFAADVLLYSRRRFYDEIAEEDKSTRTAISPIRSDSPSGPPTRKLILENMKWLFDNKVKNFTEQFQKELFLCNGCEGNFKFYGFEGVIQHYAAKHTTTLSLGSVVVHWRAEWPEHPPFHPNPSAAKAAYYAIPPPMTLSLPPQYSMPPQATAMYGEYGQTSVPIPQPSQGYPNQLSPETYISQHTSPFPIGHQYPPPVTPHYTHRPDYQVQSPAFQAGSQFAAPASEVPTGSTNGYRAYPESSNNHMQPTTAARPDGSYPYGIQQGRFSEAYQPNYSGSVYLPSQPSTVPPSVVTSFSFMSNPGGDLYQKDLNEMAQHARDVWFGTSGIKDIPQSVRIYAVIHHVVSRFQQNHTNEPSLAMFIDGLDHNPLMRPVRSLNGLACKTCVTHGTGYNTGSHLHPPQHPIDRKLYTLPHLLNHFRSVHVEKLRSTVDPQSGLESSRLDWKRDMIELPESALIVDLLNAPGMDDAKLQLIAAVFPGIFPSPLPNLESGRNLGPVPKYGVGFNSGNNSRYSRAMPLEGAQTSSYQVEVPPQKKDSVQSRPESALPLRSPSSARTSEPPGDDEYDPNRPAYYGMIIEPRQFVSNKPKASDNIPSPDLHCKSRDAYVGELSGHEGRDSHQFRHRIPVEVKPVFEKSYGDRILRLSRPHTDIHAAGHSIDRDNSATTPSKIEQPCSTKHLRDSSRYVSEDGEVVEDPLAADSIRRSASRAAGFTAAERFLNEFNPEVELARDERESSVSDARTRSRPLRQYVTDITAESCFDLVEQPVEMKLRRPNDLMVERSMRSSPSLNEAGNDGNGRYHPSTNGHPRLYDVHLPSTSHIRYSYNEDDRRGEGPSPQDHETRSASHIDYSRPGKVERIVDASHIIQGSRDWPQTQTATRRSRSRSPLHLSRGLEHYRTRSPQPILRHGAMYHIDSPSMPPEGRSQQTISYAYDPEQLETGGARAQGYPQEVYPQRFEYIPVRAGDYGYHVVTQPVEQRRMTDHIRLGRSYAGESVYERDGQLYYAEPRHAEARPIRTIPPGYVEYRDNYR